MEILRQERVVRHQDFDQILQQFSGGLAALARRAGLDNDEVKNEAWLAWQAAAGKGVGWWWAAVEKTVLRQAFWWTGGPLWDGGEPARLVPLEDAEFEVADQAVIERWRGPDGDLFCELRPEKLGKKLGVSTRRAQQKIKAATAASRAPQGDLFYVGVAK